MSRSSLSDGPYVYAILRICMCTMCLSLECFASSVPRPAHAPIALLVLQTKGERMILGDISPVPSYCCMDLSWNLPYPQLLFYFYFFTLLLYCKIL